ncbi:structural maintenance of chromosome 1, partial [Pancytospora epiphaga]
VADEERLNNELSSIMQSILLSKARKSDALKRSVIANVVDNLKSIFSGVHGRVIDLITPIQKKYELSIGVLLSSYDMAVVVDSEAVALDCIRYLKESKACRLTFIPLSVLRSKDRQRNAEYFKEDNSIKLAVHCTRCDPKYTLVSDFIFRNSLIVDSSDIGRRIAYSEKYPGNICTLGGLLMTPSGLITGGKEVKNKFDDNAIDKLLSRRASILADLGLIKDRKEAFSDIRAVKERIAELKGQYDALEGAVHGTCTTDEELESLR